MRCRILSRKMGFLQRLSPQHQSISASVFAHLRDKEPGPLIIQQCNFLEQVYNTSYSSALLEGSDSLRQIKKHLLKADKAFTWSSVSEHRSLQLLPASITWPRVWDTAREYGAPGTKSIQAIFKMLTRPYMDRSCPYCGNSTTIPEGSLFAEHVSTLHLRIDVGEIIAHLESNEEEVLDIGANLKSTNAWC